MFIAGIDGGGTRTRLELRDDKNRPVFRREFGPFNLNSIGEEAFRHLLREVFDAVGGMRDCRKICFGAAGISNPKVEEILAQELRTAGFTGNWKVCGDQEVAFRGAMDGPGITVVAGTGSICFGKNAAGETARGGGFGHLIDDGGSGYAIGRDVLSAAVRAIDGRGTGEALLRAVYRQLNGSRREDIAAFVYSSETDKSKIAQFSHIALELAEAGDGPAQQILAREASELAAMVLAVQKKLRMARCPIALLGGLLHRDNPYRRVVASRLEPLGVLTDPAHDALWGAAQMAWEL